MFDPGHGLAEGMAGMILSLALAVPVLLWGDSPPRKRELCFKSGANFHRNLRFWL